MPSSSTLRVSLALAGIAFLGSPTVRADAIDACVSAATSGQKLQREGKLRDARVQFLGCDRRECPLEVKTVCDQLLSAVETSLPTVILGARDDAGGDLLAVRVAIDGVTVAESLDGKAMPVDPGPHVLRFEHAGSLPVEEQVIVREAEKNRLVAVTLRRRPPEATAPSSASGQGRLTLAYVLGGVGFVALGGFSYLAVYGQGQFDQCSPHACRSSTVDALSVDRYLAWGALGLGVASLGAAAWLYLWRPTTRATPSLSVGAMGLPRGSGVSAALEF